MSDDRRRRYARPARHFIGTITPSGNTVVERVTLGILRDLPEVSAHFSRTPVFGSSDPSPDAYAAEGLLAAARLLAHAARACWCGTAARAPASASTHDRALVGRDHAARPASAPRPRSSAWSSCCARTGITPHRASSRRTPTPASARPRVPGARGLRVRGRSARRPVRQPVLRQRAARHGSRRWRARSRRRSRRPSSACAPTSPPPWWSAPLEAELGLPIYDTTALGVWHALRLAGVDTAPAARAGARCSHEAA